MSNQIYKDKFYTHLDIKKYHTNYQQRVENINWVSRHGFYPFIHFQMDCSKYTNDSEGNKFIKEKIEIYFMLHILIGLFMSIMEIALTTDTIII